MKTNGPVFAVTGAGNGMGREVTLEILRRGAFFLWHLNHLSTDLAARTIYRGMKDLLPQRSLK